MKTNVHSEGRDSEGRAGSPSRLEATGGSRIEDANYVTTHARSESEPSLQIASTAASQPSRLWLWFVAAFLIQAAAWTAWFVIASQNKVQEVPLTTAR